MLDAHTHKHKHTHKHIHTHSATRNTGKRAVRTSLLGAESFFGVTARVFLPSFASIGPLVVSFTSTDVLVTPGVAAAGVSSGDSGVFDALVGFPDLSPLVSPDMSFDSLRNGSESPLLLRITDSVMRGTAFVSAVSRVLVETSKRSTIYLWTLHRRRCSQRATRWSCPCW